MSQNALTSLRSLSNEDGDVTENGKTQYVKNVFLY